MQEELLRILSEEGEEMPRGEVAPAEEAGVAPEHLGERMQADHFGPEGHERMRAETCLKQENRGVHLRGRGGPGVPLRTSTNFSARNEPGATSLWNERDLPPRLNNAYKQEKAEHRIIAYLRAQGYSGVEIAQKVGYSCGAVYQILRLPWVKDVILDEIKRAGRDAVEETIQAGTLDAVHCLQDIILDNKAAKRDQIAAAKEWLNRALGMPNQKLTVVEELEVKALSDEELARIVATGRSN